AYEVNAPVRIVGGSGFNTVVVIGTEFGDDFVVTDLGVFGAGLYVTYSGIQKLVVDAQEGNDRFFIASTPIGVDVELVGGLGSDPFNVGGTGSTAPITVVSHSLDGHSALIDHFVTSTDPNFNTTFVHDISAHVADKDAAGVVVTLPNGPLRVFKNAGQ